MDDSLEDGEILDDDDDHSTIILPTTSSDSKDKESEIDRIVEESKSWNERSGKTGKPKNTSEPLVEPIVEDSEIRALRLAALGTLGKTVKEKLVFPSSTTRKRKSRDSENESSNKIKSTRHKTVNSKLNSSYRDREKLECKSLKEKDSDPKSKLNKSAPVEHARSKSPKAVISREEKEESKTSRSRVTADMVLGEENRHIIASKLSVSPTITNIEDNYDNVGMDIDSNSSEPDFHQKRNEDEICHPSSMSVEQTKGKISSQKFGISDSEITRTMYRNKYESLENLDKLVKARIDDIEETLEKRDKLTRELEDLTSKLEIYKNEYVRAVEERNNLRQDLSEYEERRINKLLFGESDMKPLDRKQIHAAPSEQKELNEQIQNTSIAVENLEVDDSMKSTDSSVNDEERLRNSLLRKFKSIQANKEKENAKDDSFISRKTHQSSISNSLSPLGSNESADEENSNNSSFASIRESLENTTVSRDLSYSLDSNRVFPTRFLQHLGSVDRNPSTEACPHELMGRCKDYSCAYLHLHDQDLDVRDLILMFVQFMSIGNHGNTRKKVDDMLVKKKHDETGYEFFVRMLRGNSKTS